MKRSSYFAALFALALGCPTPTPDDAGGTDTPMGDSPAMAMCPRANVPMPEQQMLPCCYRVSQASNLASPEARLRFIDITEPSASPLAGSTVGGLLNTSLREETFNWLFRIEGADGDGPVTVRTGFGRRNATTGTYSFSTGAAPDMPEWAPAVLTGNLMGETITSMPIPGVLTVPIFDEAMTTVQIELELRQMQVIESVMSENRSCVGTLRNALVYDTAATLGGYITLESARAGTIMFPGIMASLCGVIAGDLLNPNYCDQPQGTWMAPPDSICDADGSNCARNGMGRTCTPDGTCNAWYLEADFAAVGVDIE